MNTWKPTFVTPLCSDDGHPYLLTSGDLLVKLQSGEKLVGYYWEDLDENTHGWRSSCSEGWDITDRVDEWIELP